jgi:KDO2-lipid IV(A) lauroyltransferase
VKLLSNSAKQTKKYEITAEYVRVLEECIGKHPANRLWSHRRWKHSRPENIPLSKA